MDLDVLLVSANFMQSSIIFITLTASVPQWITIHKKKTSANISLASWYMWLAASFFGLFYAGVNQIAYGNSLALVFTTIVSFACNAYTIYLILKFQEKSENKVIKLEIANEDLTEDIPEALAA